MAVSGLMSVGELLDDLPVCGSVYELALLRWYYPTDPIALGTPTDVIGLHGAGYDYRDYPRAAAVWCG